MKVEAAWLPGGEVEVRADGELLAQVTFTVAGRQYSKKTKLELLSASLYDLLQQQKGKGLGNEEATL